MPIIEPLSAASLDYLAAFNLACVAVSPTGRVFVSRNPSGASLAWWAKADDADKIAKAAWRTGDVPEAARRLGLTVMPHSVVAKRTADRTTKIDETIAEAIDHGVLQTFNREYRKRRLQAKRNGQGFMPYSQALAKLRAVIAKSVAAGAAVVRRRRVRRSPAQPLGALARS
jgi:hypothetical protein